MRDDERQRQQGQGQGDMTGIYATNVSLFNTPLHGVINARGNQPQPVRILAFGDVPGKSPSYLVVDDEGNSKWESFEDVQIIDTSCAPLSVDALQRLAQTTGGTSRNSQSRRQ